MRRSTWCAAFVSSSTVTFGTIAKSAFSISRPLDSSALRTGSRFVGSVFTSTWPAWISTSSAPASIASRAISSGSLPFDRYGDEALCLELPGDRAVLAEVPARTRKLVTNFRDGAIPVIGECRDDDGGPTGAVALVLDLVELLIGTRRRCPSK